MENLDTLPKLVSNNYQKWGDGVAMAMKNLGIWQRYTWKDYYEKVKYFSLGLISLGLEPGDRVCIIGDNEPEWFWSEFAVQAAGGIATGIFVDSTPSEVKYITAHCGAKFAIANDQEQTDKFLEIKDELPELKKVIYWNPKGLRNYDDPIIIGFAEVMELGREYEETHPGLFEQNVRIALSIAHYGYVMENGRLVLDGPAEKLRDNEDVKEFYMGLSAVGTKKSYRKIKHYKRHKMWL